MSNLRPPLPEGQEGSDADPFDLAASAASAADLFLGPHSDDICFSLGALAYRRRAGRLLTLFSRSRYIAPLQAWRAQDQAEVTRLRKQEDAAFADACGLAPFALDLEDAMLRGREVFDLAPLEDDAALFEPEVMAALIERTGESQACHLRPWLFCPAGIGGHLDHALLALVVARNIARLLPLWRVCFYEDLFYAAAPMERFAGLRRLTQALPGFDLVRRSGELGATAAKKIELTRLYASQFDVAPTSISGFTPAVGEGASPHEAVWVVTERCG